MYIQGCEHVLTVCTTQLMSKWCFCNWISIQGDCQIIFNTLVLRVHPYTCIYIHPVYFWVFMVVKWQVTLFPVIKVVLGFLPVNVGEPDPRCYETRQIPVRPTSFSSSQVFTRCNWIRCWISIISHGLSINVTSHTPQSISWVGYQWNVDRYLSRYDHGLPVYLYLYPITCTQVCI